MEPSVSVIIPVYNGESTISYALDSVLTQKGILEILVIDDCSTDSTEQIVKGYCNKNSLVHYIKNPTNSGAAASRNHGVSKAKGEYVAFLDADDYWYGPKMEAQLALMEQTKAVLSSTARELLKSDGTETGHIIPIMDKITYKDLLKHNSLSCSAVIAKREVLLEFPMEHEDSHEDYITWLKIVKKYGYAVGLNEPYLKYRLSNTSKSGSKLKSASMTFKVYRYLGLSIPKSLCCFINYTINGIKKYYFKN